MTIALITDIRVFLAVMIIIVAVALFLIWVVSKDDD